MYWNINGLADKLGEEDVIELIKTKDIVIIAESMKGPNFKYNLPGYNIDNFPHSSHNTCKGRVPGGFLLIIKDSLYRHLKVVKRNDYVVWLYLNGLAEMPESIVYLACVYIPHENSVFRNYENDHLDTLQTDIECFTTKGTVITIGDFNARTSNLDDFLNKEILGELMYNITSLPDESRRRNMDKVVNSSGRKLINMCKYTGLQIQNGRLNIESETFTCFRHNGCSTIDYLITTSVTAQYIKNFRVEPRNSNSDHCAISFSLPHMVCDTLPNTRAKKRNITRFKWDRAHIPSYHCALQNSQCINLYNKFLCDIISPDLEHRQVIESFYKFIENPISRTFKLIKQKTPSDFPINPWFDDECKSIKRKLNDRLKQNYDNDAVSCLKKEYKRILQYKKRSYHKQIATDLHRLQSDNVQDYWKFWKSFKNKNTMTTNSLISVGQLTDHFKHSVTSTTPNSFDFDIMAKIVDHIEHLDKNHELNLYEDCPIFDSLNLPINVSEVVHALKRAKNNKASGCDGIASEFLKYSNGFLNEPLTALYNFILSSGEYPDIWGDGIVNPIHKKDSKSDPTNYRKITVLPALGKTFDSILNTRLSFIKNAMASHDPLQFGFRPLHGSTDNAFILSSLIDINKTRKKPLYVCYVDLKSAFDSVNRAGLLMKMRSQGIKGKFFSVIKSMFSKSKSTIK